MRHRRAGYKLGRTGAHRQALLRNLANALFTHGRIRTTLAKAKALRPFAERLITLGKQGSLAARRRAFSRLGKKQPVHRLFTEIAPRYADRPGGYTRITRLGTRTIHADSAPMAIIELVGENPKQRKKTKRSKEDKKQK